MAKSNVFKLLVLRAGGSAWDRERRIVGATDLPMDEAGREKIDHEVGALQGQRLSVVLSAPDEASRATAAALSEATGAKVKPVSGLAEIGMGLWEGVLGADLETRCPSSYRQWLDDPTSVRSPEGEAYGEGEDRILGSVAKALDRLKAPEDGVAVVGRTLAVGVVRCWLDDRDSSEVWEAAEPTLTRHELARAALAGVHERSRAGA